MTEVTDIQTGFFQMLSIAMADNNQSYKMMSVYCDREVEKSIKKKLSKMFNVLETTHHLVIHNVHIVFRNENGDATKSDYIVMPLYKINDTYQSTEDVIKSCGLKETCKVMLCIQDLSK